MNDPVTITRDELARFVRDTADQAIAETLNELGIKRRMINPWISQKAASDLVGRGRLEKAIRAGLVRTKVILDKKTHCNFVLKADTRKLKNDPTL